MRYRSDDPLFARYEDAVTAVVAARGATLWAGPALDPIRPAACACSTGWSSTRCRAGRAAAMFWRNAATWGDEIDDVPELIERLRAVEAADPDESRDVGAAPDGVVARGGRR